MRPVGQAKGSHGPMRFFTCDDGPELGRLRVHLLACCPGHLMDLVGPSLGVEATLRHFHVEPEPEPPEAA